MGLDRKMRLARHILAVAGALALVPNAFAQGCAMCYTTAAAAGAAAARSIDLGILVLLLPTLVLFVAVLGFFVYRASSPPA